MSSKCLPLPRTRCFLLHCKLIGFMAQSWGTALAWSRLARVSNSGNSKSRCPENPCCCLQHILEANLHFCVPRQNTGIGMYGRLTHKVKRKENQRRNCNRKCSHAECGGVKINHNHYSTTRILTVFLHYLRFFSNGNNEVAIYRCVLPLGSAGNGWRDSENTIPSPCSSFLWSVFSLI